MGMNVIKHGLCLMFLTGSAMMGAGACVATVPPEDAQDDEATAADENVAESSEAVQCGYSGPPAHCMGSCWLNAGVWVDLGNPGAGNCTQMVKWYCANKWGMYGACWGYP